MKARIILDAFTAATVAAAAAVADKLTGRDPAARAALTDAEAALALTREAETRTRPASTTRRG